MFYRGPAPYNPNFSPDRSQFNPNLSQLNPDFTPDQSQLNPNFTTDLSQFNPNLHQDGSCTMAGCSVGVCDESELPRTWIKDIEDLHTIDGNEDVNGNVNGNVNGQENSDFGWISQDQSDYDSIDRETSLGRLIVSTEDKPETTCADHIKVDNDDEWIDMIEHECKPSEGKSEFVNLLQNPERFTGYSGPSARRVWQAIQQENCFGGVDDRCLEKRVFYRLMSGLQASISTHIAREYFFGEIYESDTSQQWGINLPLFISSVGSHPDRLNNLYFTFLFVLRAVAKAEPFLTSYAYYTGNIEEDNTLSRMMKLLVSGKSLQSLAHSAPALQSMFPVLEVEDRKCRTGFDETGLFQSSNREAKSYFKETLDPSIQLKQEFKMRFRNISRIMDCVTCEKCQVWGKLQILGLGTAIKILLSSHEDMAEGKPDKTDAFHTKPVRSDRKQFLNRQEVVALINTLNQLSRSVEFAANASALELKQKLASFAFNSIAVVVVLFIGLYYLSRR